MELKYQQAIKTLIGKDYPNPIVIHEGSKSFSTRELFNQLEKNNLISPKK